MGNCLLKVTQILGVNSDWFPLTQIYGAIIYIVWHRFWGWVLIGSLWACAVNLLCTTVVHSVLLQHSQREDVKLHCSENYITTWYVVDSTKFTVKIVYLFFTFVLHCRAGVEGVHCSRVYRANYGANCDWQGGVTCQCHVTPPLPITIRPIVALYSLSSLKYHRLLFRN